jgi:type IV secretory pathway VirB2 component (pilin)
MIAPLAATAGGTMPWDGPLTTLKNELTGPVAFTCLLALAFLVVAVIVEVFGLAGLLFVTALWLRSR